LILGYITDLSSIQTAFVLLFAFLLILLAMMSVFVRRHIN